MDVNETNLNCRYNRIGHIDEQRGFSEQVRQYSRPIGEIFQRHGAFTDFGISLVHRHGELPHGHAMVHSYDTPNEDACSIEPLGLRTIYPCSYHLDAHTFRPFEFSSLPTPIPGSDFLSELEAFLRNHNLGHIVGVCHVSPSELPWSEKLSSDGKGTIATRLPRQIEHEDCITTEWIYRESGDGLMVVAYKDCITKEAGHVRT